MKDIKLYKPIGPLKYLAEYKNGNSFLGLYLQTNTRNLVFICNSIFGLIVLIPNNEDLNLFMQNKLKMNQLIKKSSLCKINQTNITPAIRICFYWWSNLSLNYTINNLKGVNILPNYYYTFCNSIEKIK
jgi:hypothetical protein